MKTLIIALTLLILAEDDSRYRVEIKPNNDLRGIVEQIYNVGETLDDDKYDNIIDIIWKWAHHNDVKLPKPTNIKLGDILELPSMKYVNELL